eukprot:1583418-Amphidinium_carterae.1
MSPTGHSMTAPFQLCGSVRTRWAHVCCNRPTMSVAPRGGPVTMVMAPSQIGTTDRLAPVRVVGAY